MKKTNLTETESLARNLTNMMKAKESGEDCVFDDTWIDEIYYDLVNALEGADKAAFSVFYMDFISATEKLENARKARLGEDFNPDDFEDDWLPSENKLSVNANNAADRFHKAYKVLMAAKELGIATALSRCVKEIFGEIFDNFRLLLLKYHKISF
jgi:hypothetical protein